MALGVTAYAEAPFAAGSSDETAFLSGIELTVQENTPNPIIGDANVPVTGQPMVGTTGNPSIFAGVILDITGQSLSSNLGDVTESSAEGNVFLTGFDLTVTNLTPQQDTLTAFAQAPFATLSPSTIDGVNVTVEATVGGIIGTFPLPMSLGNVTEITADALVPLTGFDLTMQENDVTIAGDANITLSGQALTIAQGTSEAFTDVTTEDVTGIAMSSNLNSVEITASANISLTGFGLTMQEDSVTVGADANVSPSGQALTATLNSIVVDLNQQVDVTGLSLTMQEGTATAPDSLAILTGISMTIAQGNARDLIWNPVDTGTISLWTEVDTAA